jgi:hypothetical protein
MAKEFDWILHEIFPDIDEVAPPIYSKPVPAIPVLDEPLLSKSGHSADALCAQLETDALLEQLAPLPEPSADPDRFIRSFEKAMEPDFLENILTMGKRRIDRRADIAKGSRKRRTDLREIAADCLSDLLPRAHPEQVADRNSWLDHFAQTAERLCSQVMLEAI